MPALAIPIHDLDSSGKDFVFALDASWYDHAFAVEGVRGDASAGPGSVHVHAQRNGREILVHGQAHAQLIAQCGRCLGDVPVEVTCDLAALYAPAETRARHHAASSQDAGGKGSGKGAGAQDHGHKRGRDQEDDDDLDIDPDAPDREFYTGEQVVIDDLVRDYLLLELPMQPRCAEGCSLPGAGSSSAGSKKNDAAFGEDAIDPRLMPLKKLAKNEPEKE